jgi:hypothetical protein
VTLGQIIDTVRASYLEQFATAVAERSVAGGVLTEVALRDESGAPIGEGLLQLPMRLDIVPLSGGQPGSAVSVDSESRVDFEPIEFDWGDQLQVTLESFCWDNVHLRASVTDWSPLQEWFMNWFSADDDGEGEPLGVVHFLSDPKPGSSGHALTLDLGTAPVEAFEELLDAIAACGATAVVIGRGPAVT